MKTRIILKDVDGVAEHMSGHIDIDIILDRHLVERNGRTYAFQCKVHGENAYEFREARPAYVITEF